MNSPIVSKIEECLHEWDWDCDCDCHFCDGLSVNGGQPWTCPDCDCEHDDEQDIEE